MKKNALRLTAAVLSIIISFTFFCINVWAASETNLWKFHGFTSNPVSEFIQVKTYTGRGGAEITDFFGDVTKNLLPGAVKTVSIGLHNESTYFVDFFLEPRAVTQTDSSQLAAEYFPDKTAIDALLDHMKLLITDLNGSEVYRGTFRETLDPNLDKILLGRVSPNWQGRIFMTISIDASLGNEFQGGLAALKWVFIAQDVPVEDDPHPTDTTRDEGNTSTPDRGPVETTTDTSDGTTTDDGSGNTTTDDGSGNTTTDDGSGNTTTDDGSGNTTTDEGSGNTTTDDGSGNTTTDEGSGNTTTDDGSGNTTTDTSGSATTRSSNNTTTDTSGSATTRSSDNTTTDTSGSATTRSSDTTTTDTSGSATTRSSGNTTTGTSGATTTSDGSSGNTTTGTSGVTTTSSPNYPNPPSWPPSGSNDRPSIDVPPSSSRPGVSVPPAGSASPPTAAPPSGSSPTPSYPPPPTATPRPPIVDVPSNVPEDSGGNDYEVIVPPKTGDSGGDELDTLKSIASVALVGMTGMLIFSFRRRRS
ncbi:MAG: hypothetical protein LBT44_04420 [Clostridiales bacterium]|jgi:hypothetical protein|nr:hypothetical protein [Clostridiales bacterium]